MITPTTSIIPSQSYNTSPGYDYIATFMTSAATKGWSRPAIFEWDGSRYAVVMRIPDISVLEGLMQPYVTIYKNSADPWVEQDAANRKRIRNPNDSSFVPSDSNFSEFDAVQVGSQLYVFYGNNIEIPVLTVAIFDMATDTWGSPNSSALVTGVFGTSGGNPDTEAGCTGLFVESTWTVAYNPTTNRIYIAGRFSNDINGNKYLRPAYAYYDIGSVTWSSTTWTRFGDDITFLGSQELSSMCVDCRGAVNFLFTSMDYTDPANAIAKLYLQSLYSDDSLSAIQTITTIVGPLAGDEIEDKIICTGAEFIIPIGTGGGGTNSRTSLSVIRADVPTSDTLPGSWTTTLIRSEISDVIILGWQAFAVNGSLYIVYGVYTGGNPGTMGLTCAMWTGSGWVDDATPLDTITLALISRNTNITQYALITKDFTAPEYEITDESGIGTRKELYGLISYTTPICPPTIACPINNTGTVGVPFSAQIQVSGGTPPYTFTLS